MIRIMGSLVRRFLFFVLLAAAFFILRAVMPGSGTVARISVEPKSFYIGDICTLVFKVSTDAKNEIDMPDIGAILKDPDPELTGFSEKNIMGKKILVKTYRITKYVPGRYDIPSLTVRYRSPDKDVWEYAYTQARHISVKPLVDLEKIKSRSAVGIGEKAKGVSTPVVVSGNMSPGRSDSSPVRYYISEDKNLKRIMGVIDYAKYVAFVVAGVLLLFILAVLAVAIVRGLRQKKEISPAGKALRSLSRVKADKVKDDTDLQVFYGKVYDIFADFLKVYLGCHSYSMTPDELIRTVMESDKFEPDGKEFIRDRILSWSHLKYSGSRDKIRVCTDSTLKKEIEFMEKIDKESSGAEE